MNARTAISAVLFFTVLLIPGCGGKLYDVAPLPGDPPVITAGDPGGLRVGARALDDARTLDLFSANLPLAGVLAIEISLTNDGSEPVNTKNLKFELRDSAGTNYKRISSKKALSRVMDYYGVSFYRKDARTRTREDYAAVELKTASPLGAGDERRGYLFFQSGVESRLPADLNLSVTGKASPLSIRLETQ
ncbi:MAG: hypothetical protein IPM66_18410 [Acidobacteriota bacterium]|nr:MAG: hypothetical protein IPM66_18410 [Acidobacteriota bacterium]